MRVGIADSVTLHHTPTTLTYGARGGCGGAGWSVYKQINLQEVTWHTRSNMVTALYIEELRDIVCWRKMYSVKCEGSAARLNVIEIGLYLVVTKPISSEASALGKRRGVSVAWAVRCESVAWAVRYQPAVESAAQCGRTGVRRRCAEDAADRGTSCLDGRATTSEPAPADQRLHRALPTAARTHAAHPLTLDFPRAHIHWC